MRVNDAVHKRQFVLTSALAGGVNSRYDHQQDTRSSDIKTDLVE